VRSFVMVLAIAGLARALPAQERTSGVELGIGLGVGLVSKSEGRGSNLSPTLSVDLGFGIGHGLALGVEAARYGTLDEDPETTDLTPAGTLLRDPDIFETTTVLATVRIPLGGALYVRPGLGGGQHAFASYRVGPSTVESAEVSHEWGPAAGLAVGQAFHVSGFTVAVEGVATWSGGEDSSGDRTIVALRVVPRFGL
jgi:hypothetical protein